MIPRLAGQWGAAVVTWEQPADPRGLAEAREVRIRLAASGVRTQSRVAHTLHDMERLLELAPPGSKRRSLSSYRPFLNFLETLPPPPRALAAPSRLPPLPPATL